MGRAENLLRNFWHPGNLGLDYLNRQSGQNSLSSPKLYSWLAAELYCFSKGKARMPFEFGAKVGIAVTAQGNLIVGARAYSGAPFDEHTLNEQIEQATILMQDTGEKPSTAVVDLGYRGVDRDNPGLTIIHRG
jgi:IS5 family transposase